MCTHAATGGTDELSTGEGGGTGEGAASVGSTVSQPERRGFVSPGTWQREARVDPAHFCSQKRERRYISVCPPLSNAVEPL